MKLTYAFDRRTVGVPPAKGTEYKIPSSPLAKYRLLPMRTKFWAPLVIVCPLTIDVTAPPAVGTLLMALMPSEKYNVLPLRRMFGFHRVPSVPVARSVMLPPPTGILRIMYVLHAVVETKYTLVPSVWMTSFLLFVPQIVRPLASVVWEPPPTGPFVTVSALP